MPSRLRPILLILSAAALATAVEATPLFSSGPPTAMASNRPFFDNCTVCHYGTVNSSDAKLRLSGVPAVYVPGATYTLTVSLTQSTAARWGFEVVAQGPDSRQAGAFTLTDPINMQLVMGTGPMEYVMHTPVGTRQGVSSISTWNMDWTAPAAGFGKVIISASGNAANNDLYFTGDKITNTCISSEEDDGSVPMALVAAQPDTIYAARGSTWKVPVRVTNTSSSAQTLYVVARIRLGGGHYYPSSGWLFGPVALNQVPPGATRSVTISQPIPNAAPLVSAKLEVHVGTPAFGAMDSDSIVFSILP